MADAGDDKTQILNRPPPGAKPQGPPALLRCVDTSVLKDENGVEIRLDGDTVTVGRGEENDVALNAHGISRNHARVFLEDGAWQVEDLGSTNGTRVNNSKVEKRALADGDTVAFGRACYKYSLQEAGGAEPKASGHDIDLGAADKTMIMRPGAAKPAAPKPAAPKAPAAAPAAARPAAAQAAAGSSAARASAGSGSSGNIGLLVVVVLVVAAAVGGAFYLGLI